MGYCGWAALADKRSAFRGPFTNSKALQNKACSARGHVAAPTARIRFPRPGGAHSKPPPPPAPRACAMIGVAG